MHTLKYKHALFLLHSVRSFWKVENLEIWELWVCAPKLSGGNGAGVVKKVYGLSVGNQRKSGCFASSWPLHTMTELDPRITVRPSSPLLCSMVWGGTRATGVLSQKHEMGKGKLFFPVPGKLTWF